MGQARDQFRAEVAETLTNWRLGCIAPRPDPSREQELFRSGMSEIVALRLRIAYMSLFQALARIEARVDILCNLREDPYAPLPRRCVGPVLSQPYEPVRPSRPVCYP